MKRLLCILLPSFILLLVFLACDIGGFQDLAELIDPNSPIGENSYSYMRTTTNGDGNNVCESITYSEPDGDGNGEFVLVVVVDDADGNPADWKTEVYMIRTTYNLSDGTMTHDPYFAYHNTYKAGLGNATQRDDPADFDQIVAGIYLDYVNNPQSFDDTSVPGTLSYGGNDYTSFATLFDGIMGETAGERAKQFMHMYELTIVASQTKIEGFGGMGMLQYLGRTVAFNGIRAGTFELTSEGLTDNTSDFEFKGYSDFQGLTIQGLQRSSSGTSGDGSMSGTVTFTLKGTTETWTGSVNYDAIVLEDTLPRGGYYLIKFDGIDDNGTEVDPLLTTNPGSFYFTDILPIS